jgi:hypothetical protein
LLGHYTDMTKIRAYPILLVMLISFTLLPIQPTYASTPLEIALNDQGFSTGSKSSELTRASCLARELFLDGTSTYKKLSAQEIVELTTLVNYKLSLEAVEGINVNLTCQYAYFVRDGLIKKLFPISSGKPGHETKPGTFKIWYQFNGWWESTLYPGAMMYRPKYFDKNRALHGLKSDASVRAYPDSHGCVRTKVKMMDYLWKNMLKSDSVRIYGKYQWK